MTQIRTPNAKAETRVPVRPQPSASVRLTGRGAVVALFAACFLGLLMAAWTGWSALADVIFVLACGAVTCYTRPGGLRAVVVCPPLAFFAGCVLCQLVTASGAFSIAEGILVTLATSAPWLFTGTGLTAAIAFGRGYRPKRRRRLLTPDLRAARRQPRPAPAGRSSRGRANAICSCTASTSSTAANP